MGSHQAGRRFHFLREIASGGFGSVYLAKVMHADGFSRLVAIKLLHRRWTENVEVAQRMRDEARLLGWLRHRNIVDVIDLTSIDGRAAVIMEYLEAVDLKTVVLALAELGETLPPRAALEVTAFVASALDAAYNRPPYQGEKPLRVIHRDIKPSNIMVDDSGTVKVLDFGVARAEFENRESHTQELQFGSVDYMPPERLFFEPETDLADVYSLGASLFEFLLGEKLGKAKGRADRHAAFLGDRLAALRAKAVLPGPHAEGVLGLVGQMCAYAADGRPNAAAVVQRCRALVRDLPGMTLNEWAESVVPPLVKAGRDDKREPNPLTDAILGEDSALFGSGDPGESTLDPPTNPKEDSAPISRPQGDSAPREVPREDARWEALRLAALAEIGEKPSAMEEERPTITSAAAAVAAPPLRGPSAVDLAEGPAPTEVFVALQDGPVQPAAPPTAKKKAAAKGSVVAPPPPDPAATTPGSTALPAAVRQANPASLPPQPAGAPTRRPPPDPAASIYQPSPLPPPQSMIDTAPPPKEAPGQAPRAEQAPSPAKAPPPQPASPAAAPPAAAAAPALASPAPTPGVSAPAPAAHPGFLPPPPDRRHLMDTVKVPLPDDEVPTRLGNARDERSAPRPRRVPAPLPEPQEPEPQGRSWIFPVAIGAVLLFGCAGLGVLGIAGGALWSGGGGATPTEATPTPAPSGPPPDPPAAAATTMAAGDPPDAIVFVGEGAGRLKVTCAGGEPASGTGRVAFPGPKAEKCRVEAVMKDRSRLSAEVKEAGTGTYTCFAGGAPECVRQ